MATGAQFTNKYAPLAQEWNQAIQAYQPSWSSFAKIETAQSASLQRWADITPGVLADWNGEADITQASDPYGQSHGQTIVPDGKARRITVNNFDAKMDPGLVERKATQLLEAAQRTIESVCFRELELSFTESIDNGAGSTTEKISLGHTLADSSAQSNLLTAALSASSLADARQILRSWKNHNGDPMGLGTGNLALVVSPTNEDVALKLTQSPTSVESGAGHGGANINPQSQRAWTVVTSPWLTAAADDWFVIQTGAQSPVTMWVASAPSIAILEDPLNMKISLAVSMWLNCFIDAPPNGLVGSNV